MRKWNKMYVLKIFILGVSFFCLTGCKPDINWKINVVDPDSQVKGHAISMALDLEDNPHISYCDWNDYSLKYAKRTGEKWEIQTVDSGGNFGTYLSLALDSRQYPHISYFDWTNQDLKYAKWNGSKWEISVVDAEGYMGTYVSMKIDSKDNAQISYFDWTNQDLKYARWTGTKWEIQTVDAEGSVGMYSSIAIDSNDRPHISYFDYSKSVLKYARWTGNEWDIQTAVSTIENAIEGAFTAIALDSTGHPYISYYDYSKQDLKCARWENKGWAIWVVDEEGEVGTHTSIAINKNDVPFISYYDHTKYALKCAVLKNAKHIDAKIKWFRDIKWKVKTVDADGDVGSYTSLAIDSKGHPRIAYCDYGDYKLKYAEMYIGEKIKEAVDKNQVSNDISLYRGAAKAQPFSAQEIAMERSVPQQVYIIPEADKIKMIGTKGKFRVFIENRGSRDLYDIKLATISSAFDTVVKPESIYKLVPGERSAYIVKATLKDNFESGKYGMDFNVSSGKKISSKN